MAEPDSEVRNAFDDEDLEDGEIETDEEIEEVKPISKPIAIEPAKKPKENDAKKAADNKGKDNRRSTPDNTAAKSKKMVTSDAKGKLMRREEKHS